VYLHLYIKENHSDRVGVCICQSVHGNILKGLLLPKHQLKPKTVDFVIISLYRVFPNLNDGLFSLQDKKKILTICTFF